MLDFNVTEIGADRVEELLAMLREREAWLEARGIPMWDPSKLTAEHFFARYPGARCFLCLLDDEVLGGFALVDRDEEYWPGRDGDRVYYLHKLVVKREFSGHGFADAALEWVSGFAAAKGKAALRLDYCEGRPGVAALYARCGFKPVGSCVSPEGQRLVLAEKAIGEGA